jgi:photosystem II stability/assembly factor-like uncharacterized protein
MHRKMPFIPALWLAAICNLAPASEQPSQSVNLLTVLNPRCIGPANMGGRIVDVAVVEKKPAVMYVATASGGLWKTVNNGTTWTAVFENEPTVSLGAVAAAPSDPNVVWVGTGEANPRNSVSWGGGVYRSTDGGRTWKNMGLRDSHHVGRIVIHPTDPNIVYVAALGHLWGPNRQRGVYRTSDGGKTWKRSLFINPDTGVIDVALDPRRPATLYAAAYQVRRDGFAGLDPAVQCGPGGGLYRTTDGGATWRRLRRGLPRRPLGRCGLAVSRQDPRVVYAVVQTDRTATGLRGQKPARNADASTGGVFRSQDRGRTWTKLNNLCPRPFYYGQVRIDPKDSHRIYVLGVTLFASSDGGRTFSPRNAARGTHNDHHALWIDPRDPDHLVLGGDGGMYFSYDRGATWEHVNNLPIGQFYGIAVDMRRPYRVYGGLQDNGTWGGPSATRRAAAITNADWFKVLGMDGFQCQADPSNPDLVYAEGQFGKLRRVNVRTGAVRRIVPRSPPPADAYRFDWNAPLLLSPHNPRTLYFAGNHVFRSVNQGEQWSVISPNLTRGKRGPNRAGGHAITALAESPLKPGLLFAGTDDGEVHVSTDGGVWWTEVTDNVPRLPRSRRISRIECSHFSPGTAYLTIDRHRQDDRSPYVFRTSDYGTTWTPLIGDLPRGGPVHVIREDPRNPDLLYLGTEFGLFLSLDAGRHWQRLRNGFPTVAVHDLVIHPRDRELVIATHGRSLYVLDVAPLQELSPRVLAASAHLFEVKPATSFPSGGRRDWKGDKVFAAANPPYGAAIFYHLGKPQPEPVRITITDLSGKQVRVLQGNKEVGLHRVTWALDQIEWWGLLPIRRPVPPGDYLAVLQTEHQICRQRIRVSSAE